MNTGLLFRFWYYFRQGWANYVTFTFAGVNTLTVTYYLAIEKIPELGVIFPTFSAYILIIVSLAVPIIVIIGYIHFKKSKAYKAEADISFESHPHLKRIYRNTEYNLQMQSQLFDLFLKINKDDLSDDQITKIKESQRIIKAHIDDKTQERLKQ